MKYADVIVNIVHSDVDRTFQYRIPPSLGESVRVGTSVRVPFGQRVVQGFVVELTDTPEYEEEKLKDVEAVEEKNVPLEKQLIELASWMKETYGCTMIQALKTVLPSRKKVKSRKPRVMLTEGFPEERDKFPVFGEEQQRAADGIWEEIRKPDRRPCLLYGVTGSGKTEVYMNLIARTIGEGKQAILLIPEISLTQQNLQRFYRRFGSSRIAVLNSRLSAGEKYDSLEKARRGAADLMIGPRSALFSPFPNLGLIIVDEEHDDAYNSETTPRYRSVETAAARARLSGAGLVLGSATPSVESFAAAMDRRYAVFTLRRRAAAGSLLPQVQIVDMRQEMTEGNKGIFSRILAEQMEECLSRGEQVMLFLNRRGYSGFISCRTCGSAIKCPHCDVSLTSHQGHQLVCHYCGYRIPMPDACPSCGSPYIAGFGTGTQKVEKMTAKMFPSSRILRMDLDTTSGKSGHAKILAPFSRGEADILIGTQMIVKGHDFPNVTLVGILAADLSLYSSDFRASERTFQLLTQAAGRAGRAERRGRVVIQTYSPEHYAVVTAGHQDYVSFYKQEMVYRRLMSYPPAGRMLQVTFSDPSEERLEEISGRLAEGVRSTFAAAAPAVIGPADAGIAKVQDLYRKTLIVKHSSAGLLQQIRQWMTEQADCALQADIL